MAGASVAAPSSANSPALRPAAASSSALNIGLSGAAITPSLSPAQRPVRISRNIQARPQLRPETNAEDASARPTQRPLRQAASGERQRSGSFNAVPSEFEEDAAYEFLVEAFQYARDGDLESARVLLDQAIAVTADRAKVWAMSARLELLRGNVDTASSHADRSVEEDDGSEGLFSRWFQSFTRILTAESDQPYRVRDLAGARVYPLVERALQLMNEGEFDQARALLDRALEIDRDNAYVWMVSGDLELRRGNPTIAREHLTYALDLDSDLGQARLIRGLLYIQDREYSAARADLGWAILSDQLTYNEVQVARDAIISIGGEPPYVPVDDEFEIRRLAEEVQNREEVLVRAETLSSEGSREEAVDLLRNWQDDDADFLLRRADFYLSVGNLDEALADYDTVMSSPATADQRATAARRAAPIYADRNDYDKAVDALILADRVHGLTLSERRTFVQYARRAVRRDVLRRQLTRMQVDGLADERPAAGFELARMSVEDGDLPGAQSILQFIANDERETGANRIRAWTSFAGLAQQQGDQSRAQIAYIRAADLAGGRNQRLEQLADRGSIEPAQPATPERTTASVFDDLDRGIDDEPSTGVYEPPEPPAPPSYRDRAYTLQNQGRCSSAIPLFTRAHQETGDAQYLMARAYCQIDLDQNELAISSFELAEDRPQRLSIRQRVELQEALAYLYEDEERYGDAANAWAAADAMEPSPEYKISQARTLRAAGRTNEALAVMDGIDVASVPSSERASFYDERAALKEQSDPAGSIADLNRAVAIEDTADRRVRLAEMERRMGRPDLALSHLEQAQLLDPDNLEVRVAYAYALLDDGRDEEATGQFEYVLAQDEQRYYYINEDLAYSYMRAGDRHAAARQFRHVVDNQSLYPSFTEEERQEAARRLYNVRREITELERDWYAYGSIVYRDGGYDGGGGTGTNLSQSQASLELGWIPDSSNYAIGAGYALFARVYTSLEPGSFTLQEESMQGGVGIHVKPFDDIGVILTAERLFQIGENSRNGWLFAAAHAWGVGGDWHPHEERWHVANTYVEAAWTPDSPGYVSLFGEAFAGEAFAIADRTAIIPHVVGSAHWSDDSFNTNMYGDVGLGISLRHWYGQDLYHAPRGTVDLQAQYRWYIFDGTTPALAEDGAFVGRLIVTY